MRVLVFLSFFSFIYIPAFAWQSWKGKVVNIADGDTVTVLTSDNQQIKVRLYGVDCPERRQAFGNRARQVTEKYARGQTVEVQTMDTDRYGRSVAIVYFSDDSSLNELLVNDGFAWVYDKYCKAEFICDPLKKLEARARGEKLGLWVDKNSIAPWEWRKHRR